MLRRARFTSGALPFLTLVVNPTGEATGTANTIQVGESVYDFDLTGSAIAIRDQINAAENPQTGNGLANQNVMGNFWRAGTNGATSVLDVSSWVENNTSSDLNWRLLLQRATLLQHHMDDGRDYLRDCRCGCLCPRERRARTNAHARRRQRSWRETSISLLVLFAMTVLPAKLPARFSTSGMHCRATSRRLQTSRWTWSGLTN